jgi:hypothetical protein
MPSPCRPGSAASSMSGGRRPWRPGAGPGSEGPLLVVVRFHERVGSLMSRQVLGCGHRYSLGLVEVRPPQIYYPSRRLTSAQPPSFSGRRGRRSLEPGDGLVPLPRTSRMVALQRNSSIFSLRSMLSHGPAMRSTRERTAGCFLGDYFPSVARGDAPPRCCTPRHQAMVQRLDVRGGRGVLEIVSGTPPCDR